LRLSVEEEAEVAEKREEIEGERLSWLRGGAARGGDAETIVGRFLKEGWDEMERDERGEDEEESKTDEERPRRWLVGGLALAWEESDVRDEDINMGGLGKDVNSSLALCLLFILPISSHPTEASLFGPLFLEPPMLVPFLAHSGSGSSSSLPLDQPPGLGRAGGGMTLSRRGVEEFGSVTGGLGAGEERRRFFRKLAADRGPARSRSDYNFRA
jgi:hypothetical protein